MHCILLHLTLEMWKNILILHLYFSRAHVLMETGAVLKTETTIMALFCSMFVFVWVVKSSIYILMDDK